MELRRRTSRGGTAVRRVDIGSGPDGKIGIVVVVILFASQASGSRLTGASFGAGALAATEWL